MPYRGLARVCRGSVLLLCPALVWAEPPPDAGQLLERSREPLAAQPLEPPRIDAPTATASPPASEGPMIPIRRLRISGATIFSEATLHALVADAEGRALTLAELQVLVARITRHYSNAGYLLARAYLPPQEIMDGQVNIAVLEGRLEQVLTEGSSLRPGLLRSLTADLAPGRPLRRQALERAVLLADSLPGVTAAARLRPGNEPGGTQVILEAGLEEKVAGEVSLDNHGDRYTGELQGALQLDWNNPAGRGDQLALHLQSSGEGRLYGRAAYDAPLYGAWRATLAVGSTRYELGEEFRSLEADGWARTASFDLRYPLAVSARLRVNAIGGGDAVRLVDRIGLTGSRRDKDLLAGRLGLSLQAADRWRGQSALTLQLTSGRVDIHEPDEQAFDAASVGSEGGFHKVNFLGERWQQLPAAFQLRAGVSLQWAGNNLTSAQKLAIGGPNGVRAYPSGEALGDDGQLYSLELRRLLAGLPPRWQPTAIAFAGYGRVRFNHDPWLGYAGPTTRELAAAGVGLDWGGPRGLGFAAYQAWPLNNKSALAEPDRNHRFWAAGHWRF